jgi:hypothetical protein
VIRDPVTRQFILACYLLAFVSVAVGLLVAAFLPGWPHANNPISNLCLAIFLVFLFTALVVGLAAERTPPIEASPGTCSLCGGPLDPPGALK